VTGCTEWHHNSITYDYESQSAISKLYKPNILFQKFGIKISLTFKVNVTVLVKHLPSALPSVL